MSSDTTKSTLFVSTLPFAATNAELEEFFSQVGPVRSCFVVKKDGKSTGCGYVHYALSQDAQSALAALKKVKFQGKRTLKIEMALRKNVSLKRKADSAEMTEAEKLELAQKDLEKLQKTLVKKVIPEKRVNSRLSTLEIKGLPSGLLKKVLYKKVRKFGNPKEITFIDNQGIVNFDLDTAKIEYVTWEEAQAAFKHLDQHIFKGSKMSCKLTSTVSAASIAKRARLIVRNLAFHCKAKDLETVFETFGDIVECTCPQKPDGKSRGFGFVQFRNIEAAQLAIAGMNGQKILTRPVAVDWALNKSEYDRMAEAEAAETLANAEEEGDVGEDAEKDDVNDDVDVSDDADENDEADETIANASESDGDSFVEIDEESSDDSEVEVTVDREAKRQDEQGRTLFVRNLSFETTEDTLAKAFSAFGKVVYAKVTKDNVTSLSRGNGFVLFAHVESANDCMKAYEEAKEIIQVQNPGMSNEVALNPNERPSLLAPELPRVVLDSAPAFTIDGRFVLLDYVVPKTVANELSYNGKLTRRAQDKRNLYLMREGVIFPESEAAKTLTAEQLDKRLNNFSSRKKLLQTNPNLFVSKTRLSIRGIDSKITDSQLKNEAKFAVIHFWREVEAEKREGMEREVLDDEINAGNQMPSSSRKINITQATIMVDKDRIDTTTKKPKSKGYGFVEFESHADALACLRWMNNNDKAFTFVKPVEGKEGAPIVKVNTKRPTVEFSIENNLVLKRRRERNAMAQTSERSKKRKVAKVSEDAADGQKADGAKPVDKPVATNGEVVQTNKPKKRSYQERMEQRKEKRQTKKLEKRQKYEEEHKGDAPVTKSENPPAKKAKISKPAQDKPKSKRQLKRAKSEAEEGSFDKIVSTYNTKLFSKDIVDKAVADIKKWYDQD